MNWPCNFKNQGDRIVTAISFSDIAIVSCGTLRLELDHLQAEGFLDTAHLFYTMPGLHQDIHELERQLVGRIARPGKRPTRSSWCTGANSAMSTQTNRRAR
jgi:hypothetical protein